MTHIVSR